MIYVLSKPYNPGDADPGKTYTHLHQELMTYNSSARTVQISYTYGTLDADDLFVPGASASLQSILISGEELDALSGSMANANEPALAACIRLGYEHIESQLGISGKIDYALPASPKPAAPASGQTGDGAASS